MKELFPNLFAQKHLEDASEPNEEEAARLKAEQMALYEAKFGKKDQEIKSLEKDRAQAEREYEEINARRAALDKQISSAKVDKSEANPLWYTDPDTRVTADGEAFQLLPKNHPIAEQNRSQEEEHRILELEKQEKIELVDRMQKVEEFFRKLDKAYREQEQSVKPVDWERGLYPVSELLEWKDGSTIDRFDRWRANEREVSYVRDLLPEMFDANVPIKSVNVMKRVYDANPAVEADFEGIMISTDIRVIDKDAIPRNYDAYTLYYPQCYVKVDKSGEITVFETQIKGKSDVYFPSAPSDVHFDKDLGVLIIKLNF